MLCRVNAQLRCDTQPRQTTTSAPVFADPLLPVSITVFRINVRKQSVDRTAEAIPDDRPIAVAEQSTPVGAHGAGLVGVDYHRLDLASLPRHTVRREHSDEIGNVIEAVVSQLAFARGVVPQRLNYAAEMPPEQLLRLVVLCAAAAAVSLAALAGRVRAPAGHLATAVPGANHRHMSIHVKPPVAGPPEPPAVLLRKGATEAA